MDLISTLPMSIIFKILADVDSREIYKVSKHFAQLSLNTTAALRYSQFTEISYSRNMKHMYFAQVIEMFFTNSKQTCLTISDGGQSLFGDGKSIMLVNNNHTIMLRFRIYLKYIIYRIKNNCELNELSELNEYSKIKLFNNSLKILIPWKLEYYVIKNKSIVIEKQLNCEYYCLGCNMATIGHNLPYCNNCNPKNNGADNKYVKTSYTPRYNCVKCMRKVKHRCINII